ncbi:hypothetical protein N9L68_09135 [bacterium]|nr:hypothetical protein [bacterium]
MDNPWINIGYAANNSSEWWPQSADSSVAWYYDAYSADSSDAAWSIYWGGKSKEKGGTYFIIWYDTKNPPYWEPSIERVYPFREWKEDIKLWHLGTELTDALVGPAIARRLGSSCSELVRSLDGDMLRDGNADPVSGRYSNGMPLLMQALQDRHDKFPVETPSLSIIGMLKFNRRHSLGIDETLSRYDNLRSRVKSHAVGFDLPHAAASWILLEALGIPTRERPLPLQPHGGTFPTKEEGMITLSTTIRQQGHIMEAGSLGRPGGSSYYGDAARYDEPFPFPNRGAIRRHRLLLR